MVHFPPGHTSWPSKFPYAKVQPVGVDTDLDQVQSDVLEEPQREESGRATVTVSWWYGWERAGSGEVGFLDRQLLSQLSPT